MSNEAHIVIVIVAILKRTSEYIILHVNELNSMLVHVSCHGSP